MPAGSIFGVLRRDGSPVAVSALRTLAAALSPSALAKETIWTNDAVGIGSVNPPDACREFSLGADRVVLTSSARIDNREDLFAAFGWSTSRANATATDDELIVHAYRRWGDECVSHLIGDWAFALWDARKRRLLVARDHLGVSSLYYYADARIFAFASSIRALIALPEVPKRPNLLGVARILTYFLDDDPQTAYEDVCRLNAGHRLIVDAGTVERRRYWHFEGPTSVRLASDGEYVEAFLDVYGKAISSRLRFNSRIGLTLSSGLDSGSVAALAVRQLGKSADPLLAFTSVPVFDATAAVPSHQYGDESALVDIVCERVRNIESHRVRADDISPVEGVRLALHALGEPVVSAANQYWVHAAMRAAVSRNVDVLLTGQMGNLTVSWAGRRGSFWPLIRSGRLPTLCSAWKEKSLPAWVVAKRYLLGPAFFQMGAAINRVKHRVGHAPWASYSPVNPKVARELRLVELMYSTRQHVVRLDPYDDLRGRMIQDYSGMLGSMWAGIGASHGIAVCDPTMDERVIEFCLGIPDEQCRGQTHDRWLMRRAMKGLLPDAVRLNTRRGRQAADLGYRILAALPEMEAALATMQRSELARTVLDVSRLTNVFDALKREVNIRTTQECSTLLMPGVMTGLFLSRF